MMVRELELEGAYKSISPEASAVEAISLMAEYKVPMLFVERMGPGDTQGVLTKRDVVARLIGEGMDPEKVTVGELATKPLIVVNNLDVSVEWVAVAMARNNVSSIAIFDRGEFKGFVTDRDVLRAWLKELEEEAEHEKGVKA